MAGPSPGTVIAQTCAVDAGDSAQRDGRRQLRTSAQPGLDRPLHGPILHCKSSELRAPDGPCSRWAVGTPRGRSRRWRGDEVATQPPLLHGQVPSVLAHQQRRFEQGEAAGYGGCGAGWMILHLVGVASRYPERNKAGMLANTRG